MATRIRSSALLTVPLDPLLPAPLFRQLYDGLRQSILDGRLAPGVRLPATRGLATELGVSRNTVRKVVRSGETCFGYERQVQPLPKLGPWTSELERLLEANERKARRERLTLVRELAPVLPGQEKA